MTIDGILNKVRKTNSLTENEVLELLKTEETSKLFSAADAVRKEHVGDEVHLRALIEFSNICKQNCLYCGLRSGNSKTDRYRLEPKAIIELASKAKSYGYQTVVLQSGEDSHYTPDIMTGIISEIKKMDMAVTLSVGEKTFEEYKAYKEAGADRYLLRIETTDKSLYERLDPGMSLENRKECLKNIKKLGYETGSGILAGLPGQTLESIAKDILYLKSIPVDMAGIGPFIYNPDTPIDKNFDSNEKIFELSLRIMAILRLLMPDINIPATTAMEILDPEGRMIALKSGANVVMPNATEGEYSKKYELYPGKTKIAATPRENRINVENKIKSIGRSVSKTKGMSKTAGKKI